MKGYWTRMTEDEERAAMDRIAELELALSILYEEVADYIRINNLGDILHNDSMKRAHAALTNPIKWGPK